MQIKEMFAKPIDRHIEGVVKADDVSDLRSEVDEYVITTEVGKNLPKFIDAYAGEGKNNGVWISGFFGSGKSHLLKMLALLLENKELAGARVVDLFLDKFRDSGDAFLTANLKKIAATPSRSVLFNIDQKANLAGKTDPDALLAVFARVFDEVCGYHGKEAHVAEFERRLDARGLYEDFKREFAARAGLPWEDGRNDTLFYGAEIDKATLAARGVSEGNPDMLESLRKGYKLSIEDFAKNVKTWLDKQGADFRINFFVDEAGQFINRDVKLMLNLQTIVESLATVCEGRAWVVVTSQEELDDVAGVKDEKSGADFSKIQARFDTRLPLGKESADEVIQKRLLAKNAEGGARAGEIFDDYAGAIKNLFNFPDGKRTWVTPAEREAYVAAWPFAPYQFTLFRDALAGLSNHEAFEGRHNSVGARSMLGVFQEALVGEGDKPDYKCAPFDRLFDCLRNILKSDIQKNVKRAERVLDNFAARTLKALCLVRHVDGFAGSERNLRVLLLESPEDDLPALTDKIKAALRELEDYNYIRREGDEYLYLTDEEKDIEAEIKATTLDHGEAAALLGEYFYERVLQKPKMASSEGYLYDFTKKIDGESRGKEHDLEIKLITTGEEQKALMDHAGKRVLLVLPEAEEFAKFARDLDAYGRERVYLRRARTRDLRKSEEKIIKDKESGLSQKEENLVKTLEEILKTAKLAVGEKMLNIDPGEVRPRFARAFESLVAAAYPERALLRGAQFTTQNFAANLRPAPEREPGEAEEAVLEFLRQRWRGAESARLKDVINNFSGGTYGWPKLAILAQVARLVAAERLEIRLNGEAVNLARLGRELQNSALEANFTFTPQTSFDPEKVRVLRDLYGTLFPPQKAPDDPRELIAAAREGINGLLTRINELLGHAREFPFLAALKEPAEKLAAILARERIFEDLVARAGQLRDYWDNAISPLTAFMGGKLKNRYREAAEFHKTHEADKDFLPAEDWEALTGLLQAPDAYKGGKVRLILEAMERLAAASGQKLASEKENALAEIARREEAFMALPEYAGLSGEARREAAEAFAAIKREIAGQTFIVGVNRLANDFKDRGYDAILNRAFAKTAASAPPPAGVKEAPPAYDPVVPIRDLRPQFNKILLATPADAEAWLASMRENLLAAISQGKKVRL